MSSGLISSLPAAEGAQVLPAPLSDGGAGASITLLGAEKKGGVGLAPEGVVPRAWGMADGLLDTSDFGPAVFEAAGGLPALRASLDAEIQVVPKEYCVREALDAKIQEGGGCPDEPFYLVDLTTVLAKLARWREMLPRVKPFYAIKCNEDPAVTRLLAMAGCGFDCASQLEINMALSLGVSPGRIVYANPCKQKSMLRFARDSSVRLMTVDNAAELSKIASSFPEARCVLRIAVDDSKSVCRFNSKFGAAEAEWRPLLSRAKALGLDICGVSFHVGSGCSEPSPFASAVESARRVFDMASSFGFNMTILDCGGGFPGCDDTNLSFSDIASVLGDALDTHFPVGCGVDLIAEPGRYMVSASHTYAVAVIGKRELSAEQLCDAAAIETFGAPVTAGGAFDDDTTSTSSSSFAAADDNTLSSQAINSISPNNEGDNSRAKSLDPDVALYINDGVYGSFNCVVFDHAVLTAIPLDPIGSSSGPLVGTKLFGPTCDSIDVVMACTMLPSMKVGDWIYFEGMGGYTRCASSRFNGQGGYKVHYVWAGSDLR
mmetsp:Transcript_30438/g.71104  ORF Transcript_30438/g.71104 Transcript_30438/m.71104 type:complete len:545 (+) Transcript_30438:41-1675(+)